MTSPAPVWSVVNGVAAYWALVAAVDLGVFDALAERAQTTAELAVATDVAEIADLDILVALLAAVDLLTTDGETWALTDAADRFLVSTSPTSMADLVHLSPGSHAAWPDLAATMRAGAPSSATLAATDELMPRLVAATAATQRSVAAGVGAELDWAERPVIVDLGCGTGAWLTTLVDAAGSGARGIGVDLPHVIASVESGSALSNDAVELLAGDYLDTALPVEHADVVVLAHVLRSESAERAEALVARALQLLAPDGTLIVADYFTPGPGADTDTYRASRHALTLAVTMRVGTAGRGVTEEQLASWCHRHGAVSSTVVEPVARQRVHLIHRTNGVAR